MTQDRSGSKTPSHLGCCIYSVSVTPHFRLGIREPRELPNQVWQYLRCPSTPVSAWWIYTWTKQNLIEDVPAFTRLKQKFPIHPNPVLCTEFLTGRMGGGRRATASQSISQIFSVQSFFTYKLNCRLTSTKNWITAIFRTCKNVVIRVNPWSPYSNIPRGRGCHRMMLLCQGGLLLW